jgi:hypothetical protein
LKLCLAFAYFAPAECHTIQSVFKIVVAGNPNGIGFEPVSVSRTGLGEQKGSNCMNETNTAKENTAAQKRPRRHYDAEFKRAAVEHCARHGGDLSRTAGELGVN